MDIFIDYFKKKLNGGRFFIKTKSSFSIRYRNIFYNVSKKVPNISSKYLKLNDGVCIYPLNLYPIGDSINDVFIKDVYKFLENNPMPFNIYLHVINTYIAEKDFTVYRIIQLNTDNSIIFLSNIPEFKDNEKTIIVNEVFRVIKYLDYNNYKEILIDVLYEEYKRINPDKNKNDFSLDSLIQY